MRGIVLIAVLFFVVWDAVWWGLGVRPLFPWQLQRRLDSAPDQLLLDVRTPLEFAWFHLPGARNEPDLLLDASKVSREDPERTVVVICMTGHRSPLVAHALQKRGFKQVYNLTWGMLGWQIYRLLTWIPNRLMK